MLSNKILKENLFHAIYKLDIKKVLLLLELGANPNATDKQGNSCLTNTIVKSDQKAGLEIVRHLLTYGADPLFIRYGNNALDEAGSLNSRVCLETLINHLVDQNRCHEIDLCQVQYWWPELSVILEHGAYINADEAFYAALEEYDAGKIMENYKLFFFANIKKLYYITKQYSTVSIELSDKELKQLISISWHQNDYDFILTLINDHLMRLPLLSERNANNLGFNSLFLCDDHTNTPTDASSRKALIVLTLFLNHISFYKTTINIIHCHNQQSHNKISFNIAWIRYANIANSLLQTIIYAFLNQFGIDSFPNNLPLNLRIKIALERLHQDIPEIRLIRNDLLVQLLLLRMTDYEINYNARVLTSLLLSAHKKLIVPVPKTLGLYNSLQSCLYNIIREYDAKNIKSEQMMFQRVIDNMIKNHSDQLNQYQPIITNAFTNLAKLCNLKKVTFLEEIQIRGLTLAILIRDQTLLSLLVRNTSIINTTLLTNMSLMTSNKMLITFTSNLHEKDYDWFKSTYFHYGILNGNIDAVMLILENNIELKNIDICEAIKSGNVKIISEILKYYQKKSFELLSLNLSYYTPIILDITLLNRLFEQYHDGVANLLLNYFFSIFNFINRLPQKESIIGTALSFFNVFAALSISNKSTYLLNTIINMANIIGLNIKDILIQRVLNSSLAHYSKSIIIAGMSSSELLNLSFKNNTLLQKLFLTKISHYTFSNYIQKKEEKRNLNNFLNITSSRNYKSLVHKLQFSSLGMSHQGIENLTNYLKYNSKNNKSTRSLIFNQILIREEKFIYHTLMQANWKLTHLIHDVNDLAKILSDKEIRSPLYLNVLCQTRVKQSTPSQLDRGGYVFATLGPQKSPVPSFLSQCAGIEIDVNALLTKHPHFFDNAIASGHWYAFHINQTQNSILYKDCILHTYHHNFQQHNEFVHENSRHDNFHTFSETLFTGKRLIHFLCLQFIYHIRWRGSNFYQEIINHSQDIDFLSTAFCHVMHSGVLEIRYPYSIPLHPDYYRIINVNRPLVFNTSKEQQALMDINFFRDCIKSGFDPNLNVSYKLNSNSTICGNVLAFAVATGNKTLINEITEKYTVELSNKYDWILSPLSSAFLMNDYKTLFTFMTQGVPANSLGLSRILAKINKHDLLSFLALADHESSCHLFKFLPQNLLIDVINFIASELANTDLTNKEHLFTYLYTIVQIPVIIDINLSFAFGDLLRQAVLSKSEKIIRLLISSGKISLGIDNFELIIENLPDSISLILTELFNKRGSIPDILLLILVIAGFQDKFSLLLNIINLNIDLLTAKITNLLDKLYSSNSNTLVELLYKYQHKEPYWVHKQSFELVLWLALQPKYIHYINTTDIEYLKISFSFFKLTHSFWPQFEYITKNLPLRFLYTFVKNCFYVMEYENINYLLKFLVNGYRELYIYFINKHHDLNFSINFDYLLKDISYLVANYKTKKFLIKFLSLDQVIQSLLYYCENSFDSASCFVNWLILMIDSSLFSIIFTDKIKNFAKYHSFEIINYLQSLTGISLGLSNRLKIVLHEIDLLFPSFDPENYLYDIMGIVNFAKKLALTNTESINPVLRPKRSGVAFITRMIDGKACVYLGNKICSGTTIPILLAPGGFINKNESIIDGIFRELIEEISLDLNNLIHDFSVGDQLAIRGKYTTSNLDENTFSVTIRYCHKFKKIDNLNLSNQYQERIIAFISIELPANMHNRLECNDDFANGQWVPLCDIKYDSKTGKYFYQTMEIRRSNGMLLEELQGQFISRNLIDEAIEEEVTNAYLSRKRIVDQMGNHSFFQPFQCTNKRPLENSIERPENEIKKVKLSSAV